MGFLEICQFFGISLAPFGVAVVLHLIFKFTNPLAAKKPEPLPSSKGKFFYRFFKYPFQKFLYTITNTKRGPYWWKQFVIGAVFAALSIAGYFFGAVIHVDNENLVRLIGGSYFIVGNSTVSPVVAGLIFGWPAGVFSGLISSIFRACMGGWLGWPTAIALFCSGAFAGAASHFLFKDKLPPWYFIPLVGVFVETLNITLIFAFNMHQVTDTYSLVSEFDSACIIFAAFTTTLTGVVISLIDKTRLLPRRKDLNNVSFSVQSVLFLTCVIGMVIMTFSVQGVSSYKSEQDFSQIAVESLGDVQSSIDSIEEEINILYPKEEDKNKRALALLLAMESIPDQHHVSTRGFVITVATKKATSIPPLSHNEDDIMGVPDIHRSEIGYGARFSFSVRGKEFYLSETDKLQENKIEPRKNFYAKIAGRTFLMNFDEDRFRFGDGPYAFVVVLVPYAEIESDSGVVFRIALYTNILVSIAIFAFAEYFVNRKIVQRIEMMDKDLEVIMGGDLEKKIDITGYNEFTNLSNNINLTVGALKNYAQEVETRIESELQFARDIQTNSVPTAFPYERSYNIYAKMEPAKEVGGDFYDYFKMNNGRILFLIADVSGKGIPAAMFMMRARTLIKSLSSTDIPLEEIVKQANRDLCSQNEAALFVTAWIGILDPNNGELRYVNCGHMNPLLKKKGQKFVEFKNNNHNFVLAANYNYDFKTDIMYLEPGDEIVLYTDGVTEAQNKNHELYGIQRFINIVNSAKYFNAKQLLDEVSDDVTRYADGQEQFDDTTLLIMRYLGNADIIPETAITLKARPSNASIAVNFVESILMKYNLPLAFVAKVSIVVDELFANIAFYAYPEGHVGEATIQVDFRDDSLFLTMIDSGVPFDPTIPREVDTTSDISKRKRGGLGIFIVKNTMDELRYEYKDNKNILNLVKHLDNIPADKVKKDDAEENK